MLRIVVRISWLSIALLCIAVHVQCHWHPLPHLPLHDWPMLAQPQLPDDARRLAFVPMQSAEPFRSGRELWEGQ